MVLVALASVYLLVRVALRRPPQSRAPTSCPIELEYVHFVSHTMRGDMSEVAGSGLIGPQRLTAGEIDV